MKRSETPDRKTPVRATYESPQEGFYENEHYDGHTITDHGWVLLYKDGEVDAKVPRSRVYQLDVQSPDE